MALRSNDRAGRRSCCQGARRFRLPRHASYIGVFRAPPGTGTASRSGSWLHIGVLGSWVISDGAKLVHLISPCPFPRGDGAYNRLTAGMDVDMLYPDVLLPFAAMTPESST